MSILMQRSARVCRWLHRALATTLLLGGVGLGARADQPAAPTAPQLIQQFKAHNLEGESLIQVVADPQGSGFATFASDGSVRVWSGPAVLRQQFGPQPAAMLFNGFITTAPTTYLAAAYNGVATRWSPSGQVLQTYAPHLSGATDVVQLPGTLGVVTSSDDGSIRFWTSEGRLKQRIQRPGVSRYMAVAPKRQLVAVSQDISTVTLLSATGSLLSVTPVNQGRLNDLVFTPDERLLITAGFDGSIKIWAIDNPRQPGKLMRTLPAASGSGWLEGLAVNRAGVLAAVSDDGVLRLWSLDGQLRSSLKLSTRHLLSVSFSADGQTLYVAAQDGTVSVLRITPP